MGEIRILVVEDDGDISNMLLDLLGQNGYSPSAAYSGTEAVMRLEREQFSLMLLDLMLPGKPGSQVLAELRQAGNTMPVIALTAVGETASKVELLQTGADDYITKPFDNGELLARIQVQLRHAVSRKKEVSPDLLVHGELQMDLQSMSVSLAGESVPLTRRELLILKLLMEYPKKVFTKNNIYETVWGEEFWGDENTVNVHISNIRTKLGKIRPGQEYIQTVWGIGFKMTEEAAGPS